MNVDTEHQSATSLRPIVVAVDGSAKNRSAFDWAVAEAARTNRELHIVTASSSKYVRPAPFFSADYDVADYDQFATTTVTKLEKKLRRTHPTLQVRAIVKPREAAGLILDASVGAELTVVGKRGLGAFARMMVGSTSIAVAGRSLTPTVVVPERWNLVRATGRPIVVGVDVEERSDQSLGYAFEYAHELGVRLIAVHGWQAHPEFTLSEADRLRWGEDALRAMHGVLRPWEDKYPDVVLEVMQRHEHPSVVLLEKADAAQLLVLGRHTPPTHMGGFVIGSVDRAVLHYSTTPVVVVPDQPRQ